ncbi:hypothetical protein CYMTET_26614 [Cymbomonas tetramitiformis]|uniref:Uncharacterized protein n=1 Tax=Cymbomonas tetramitiformis TaxID=36881 RepID=A0AAE0KXR7_9CHLO|nr:hypothetical protein CYMTET_26614 [Cymbomonas tetramitiformis]
MAQPRPAKGTRLEMFWPMDDAWNPGTEKTLWVLMRNNCAPKSKKFCDFCESKGREWLPASEEMLITKSSGGCVLAPTWRSLCLLWEDAGTALQRERALVHDDGATVVLTKEKGQYQRRQRGGFPSPGGGWAAAGALGVVQG